MKRSTKSVLTIILGVLLLGFAAIQLLPYGHNHSNPPVVQEPNWDTSETRILAKNACFDCHSNETVWLWYSNVAPVSWLVQRDVEKGRKKLNFSEWGGGKEDQETEEVVEEIRKGKMPMPIYLLTHAEARMSDAQKEQLIQGWMATTAIGDKIHLDRHEHKENDD